MAQDHGLDPSELFKAQAHIYKHIFNYANSMCLATALQLNIPDIIVHHKNPITLQHLSSSLHLPPEKTTSLQRLMRLLVHSGFFSKTKFNDQESYLPTPSSILLTKNGIPSLLPFVQGMVDPVMVNPWMRLGDWFKGEETTPFEIANGSTMWDYCDKDPVFNKKFNEAMASDSMMMSMVVGKSESVFCGINSVVDVGGGTGVVAKIILEAFPNMKCIVFDLPHVVEGLIQTEKMMFVGGDMFQSFPSADAILFKCVLHNWSDENCVKILKKCREAIPSKDKGGKVIIIDMVVDEENDEFEITEAKLIFDMIMMVLLTGRERNKKEWEKIFLEAGFSHYKISSLFGLRSLIEVYP
ncbi:trans-resveratrol di-O-methyltransferase-like [Impatiens glandulifera]|uniref:trans-resveratrol di-O-methyltransferase-like n=1 Tax=Impatiens glandulifera TaxID=253017 RepID=UPI001FB101BF|nr:trans-resveratrol di-O-methyltransferase-like [Impatiens glandulifera]